MIPLSESLFEWLDRGAAGLRNSPESRLALDRFLMNLVGELSTMLANPYRRCPAWLQEAAAELERQPEHLKLGSRALAVLAGRTPEHVARELRRFAWSHAERGGEPGPRRLRRPAAFRQRPDDHADCIPVRFRLAERLFPGVPAVLRGDAAGVPQDAPDFREHLFSGRQRLPTVLKE